jgi:hypothetical protein
LFPDDSDDFPAAKHRALPGSILGGPEAPAAVQAVAKPISGAPSAGRICRDEARGPILGACCSGDPVAALLAAQRAFGTALSGAGVLSCLSAPQLSKLHAAHLEQLGRIQEAEWRLLRGSQD